MIGETAMDVAAVCGWESARSLLLENPELVRDDAQLLMALGLKPAAANIIEFGPAALARLEAARVREITARQELEAMMRANFTAQLDAHALIVDLLDARNNADLAARLNEGAQRRFGLETAAIAIEGLAPAGWRSLPMGLLDFIVGPERPHAVGPCTGGAEIFGAAGAARVQSVALARLCVFDPGRQGLVAFGSADPEGFTPEMSAELIGFIARVVERTAERWPLQY